MDTEHVLFEIVVGTYEKFLLGYYLQLCSDEFSLKQSFSTKSHDESVKCLASSSEFLASGSIDESVKLFNLKSRQEIGALDHHNGTVTCLEFYDPFLISCSEDKTICVWSTSNWKCLKILSGHKNAVNYVSIHPSGKMALSVSKDKTLRTWNLIKGRSAYATNIKKEADMVKWSPDGSYFVVVLNTSIDVYSVENAAVLHTINFQHRICDLTFVKDNICAVVGDQENVCFYDVAKNSLCHEFKAHKNRVKAIRSISVNGDLFLSTASSDGQIKVWHMDVSEMEFKIRKIAKVKTGSRPTCMTVMNLQT